MTSQLTRPSGQSLDNCTNSNYKNFKVINTDLDLHVSFDDKVITGTVTFDLETINQCDNIILDTSYLFIRSVSVDKQPVDYKLCARKPIYGSPLEINHKCEGKVSVSIEFSTTEKSTSIQFIRGDTGPYLFSQSEMIHARSFFPCFDTPAIKSPYTFKVESPHRVLMSARPIATEENVYKFKQPVPIPSYLVAIASGNIVSAPIGPRSEVYSETPNIADCQWEFENDMENFLKVAESLTFAYEWETFDVLVLPMSFPYGGMENPNITFATPTLICKDRSQVKVIAHELAHSWAGNLVTNCSWEHFWLNEGWCVYLERRILGGVASLKAKMEGRSDYVEYGEKSRHFDAILGYGNLKESVNNINPAFTSLVWDLNNCDPDDAFSKVPYEKGFFFLFYLETILGGPKEFDEFIPHYFKTFRYKSLDSFEFIDELYKFFEPRGKKDILDSIDFNKWLFGKGMPEEPNFDRSLVVEVEELVEKWLDFFKTGKEDFSQFSTKDIETFEVNQHMLFLDKLCAELEKINPSSELIMKLPEVYPYYPETGNFELIASFNTILIKYGNLSETHPVVVKFANWLGTVGRMKYVRPGFKLLNTKVSNEFAIATYKKYESLYHPICKSLVEKDIGLV